MAIGKSLPQTLKTISLYLALVICMLGATAFACRAAQAQATLRVAPESQWVRIGKTTDVEVMVEQVSGLYGAEIHLSFDPETLEVIDMDAAKPGIQIEPGTLPYPDFVVLNQADNQAGTIDYAATQMPPNMPESGQGVIARITFYAKKADTTRIEVDQFLLADTDGKTIDALSQSTQIEVRDYSVLISLAAGAAIALLVLGAIGLAYQKKKVRQCDV